MVDKRIYEKLEACRLSEINILYTPGVLITENEEVHAGQSCELDQGRKA